MILINSSKEKKEGQNHNMTKEKGRWNVGFRSCHISWIIKVIYDDIMMVYTNLDYDKMGSFVMDNKIFEDLF